MVRDMVRDKIRESALFSSLVRVVLDSIQLISYSKKKAQTAQARHGETKKILSPTL
jgi:hypothetical protein